MRASWSDAGDQRSLDHWYINLHTPLRRSRYGFDIEDLVLDVVVSPDRRSWSWKDEADFDVARANGTISREKAERIRATGTQVAAQALRGDEPFTAEWEHWRPSPEWRLPVLPSGCLAL